MRTIVVRGSLVNLRLLVPLLASLSCHPRLFIGSMQWTAWIPQDHARGIRGTPCAEGAGLYDSLLGYGRLGCASQGAVLPFPYAFGMGYIFSGELLRWVATAAVVREWVQGARGETREELQWQHYEDTTTGYWLAHSPDPITYLSLSRWAHDFQCSVDPERRAWGAMSRPPSESSVLVHRLKTGGFRFAWDQVQPASSYDHAACLADAFPPQAREVAPPAPPLALRAAQYVKELRRARLERQQERRAQRAPARGDQGAAPRGRGSQRRRWQAEQRSSASAIQPRPDRLSVED